MTPDEQEALSIKHNCARIVRLSSGNLALFAPWTNGNGMPLVHIGPMPEIDALIPTAAECASWVESITPVREYAESKLNLAHALGIEKPTIVIGRRI